MRAALRAGLVGIGMMGRNHARVLHEIEGVDLVGVADPAGDRHNVAGGAAVVGTVDELVALGLDMAVVAVARPASTSTSASSWPRAGVPTLIEKPLATDTVVVRPAGRGVRVRRTRQRGRPHRALQPCAALAPRAAGQRRPRRDLPGRHPSPGSVPEPDRRRRRGQGPRHPRHRPHALGDPVALRRRSRRRPPTERSRARGPDLRHRADGRRAPSSATWSTGSRR